MNRAIAIGILAAILCVQGVLLWHFTAMDTNAHAPCPVAITWQMGCTDMSDVIASTSHHTSLFFDLITAVPASVILLLLFFVTLFAFFIQTPRASTRQYTRVQQRHAKFRASQKLLEWLAALRLQGIGPISPVAA
ncbi:MAG: hypothetical protein AAB570_03910 [Patescibacteria group bacterium]